MPADLRSLMAEPSFRLTPLAAVDDAALDAPLTWAHNSDLPDPTPWLEPGGLLLTDGAPFLPPHNAPVDDYVERLVALGVRALGVSVGILVDRVPPALVAACERLGMPLIEVSRQTPFMGVIKAVSDATAADERARLERSLLAQRRVARAALRPDGLSAILRELERALETWVALFDASGALVLVSETTGIPAALDEPVREAAAAALAGRRAAAARVSLGGVGEVTLQTLGQHGNLRGVLAVGISSATFDRARQDLVDSVIALASISLEQSSTLDSARRRLRSGILELLAAGVTDVAGDTVKHLWGRLPPAPLRVARLDVLDSEQTLDSHPLIPALEVLAEKRPGALFFAQQDDHVVAVYTDGDDAGLFAAAAPITRREACHPAWTGIRSHPHSAKPAARRSGRRPGSRSSSSTNSPVPASSVTSSRRAPTTSRVACSSPSTTTPNCGACWRSGSSTTARGARRRGPSASIGTPCGTASTARRCASVWIWRPSGGAPSSGTPCA